MFKYRFNKNAKVLVKKMINFIDRHKMKKSTIFMCRKTQCYKHGNFLYNR